MGAGWLPPTPPSPHPPLGRGIHSRVPPKRQPQGGATCPRGLRSRLTASPAPWVSVPESQRKVVQPVCLCLGNLPRRPREGRGGLDSHFGPLISVSPPVRGVTRVPPSWPVLVWLPTVVGAPWALNTSCPAGSSLSGGPGFLPTWSPLMVSDCPVSSPLSPCAFPKLGKTPAPRGTRTTAVYPALALSDQASRGSWGPSAHHSEGMRLPR